ncbi:MAG: TRAP transporter small permease [Granulosicoccus sp.]
MEKFYTALERFARMQLAIAALAIFAILVAISLDVILRSTIRAPLTGTMEVVSFYCMIPVVFLPIMLLEIRGEHIETDLFFRFFPVLAKKLSIIVSGLLSIGIYCLLAFITYEQAISSTSSGEVSMGVNMMPIWPVRWILPFVFASSAIAALVLSIRNLTSSRNV